mmetsp:Transcript_46297/g.52305  ORF Transcript_46297/g.52305 Transcript_46297/m.52305 type:complete len:150 (-) Transcript_46297:278-727(-)
MGWGAEVIMEEPSAHDVQPAVAATNRIVVVVVDVEINSTISSKAAATMTDRDWKRNCRVVIFWNRCVSVGVSVGVSFFFSISVVSLLFLYEKSTYFYVTFPVLSVHFLALVFFCFLLVDVFDSVLLLFFFYYCPVGSLFFVLSLFSFLE